MAKSGEIDHGAFRMPHEPDYGPLPSALVARQLQRVAWLARLVRTRQVKYFKSRKSADLQLSLAAEVTLDQALAELAALADDEQAALAATPDQIIMASGHNDD